MKYKPGDFSFVYIHQNIFEYDYSIVDKIGKLAWDKLKRFDEVSYNNYIVEIINNSLYPGHSSKTYKLSIQNLKCIAIHGWDYFVENYEQNLF
jgi:hypothetical protein